MKRLLSGPAKSHLGTGAAQFLLMLRAMSHASAMECPQRRRPTRSVTEFRCSVCTQKPKYSSHITSSRTKTFFHHLENDKGLPSLQKGVRKTGILVHWHQCMKKKNNNGRSGKNERHQWFHLVVCLFKVSGLGIS